MTNYKPFGHNSITIGGYTIELTPLQKPIMLYDRTLNSSAVDACKILDNAWSGTQDYQVPADTTYRIVGLKVAGNGSNDILTVSDGSTVSDTTPIRITIETGTHLGWYEYYISGHPKINATNYCVIDPTNLNINHIFVYGYEVKDV